MLAVTADGHALDRHRLRDHHADALGQRARVVFVGQVLAQHRELVAAKAGDGVGRTEHVVQAAGHDSQELVAGLVTQPVVHRLEAVEVEEQQRHQPRTPFDHAPAPARAGRGKAARLASPVRTSRVAR